MPRIELPSAMRVHAGNQRHVDVAGDTVGAALAAVETAYPALRGYLLNAAGQIPRHVVIFVGEQDVRAGQGAATALNASSVVTVLLPVAGGSGQAAAALSRDEIQRYGRQLLLPWMTGQTQQWLRDAHVDVALIAGDTAAHWLCMYLAAAGVGHFRLHVANTTLRTDADCNSSPLFRRQLGTVIAPHGLLGVQFCSAMHARFPHCTVELATPSGPMRQPAPLHVDGHGNAVAAMAIGSQRAAQWLRTAATR
ncbi:MAG TPA: MoaD/ThiS family protein [Kofleriaceae bacterium]|nr:MoaD/ThiS family protein [Kofleriaceae bacterium]